MPDNDLNKLVNYRILTRSDEPNKPSQAIFKKFTSVYIDDTGEYIDKPKTQHQQKVQEAEYQRFLKDPFPRSAKKYMPTGNVPPPPKGYIWYDYRNVQPYAGQYVWVWNGEKQRLDYLVAGIWWKGGDDVTYWRPAKGQSEESMKYAVRAQDIQIGGKKEEK